MKKRRRQKKMNRTLSFFRSVFVNTSAPTGWKIDSRSLVIGVATHLSHFIGWKPVQASSPLWGANEACTHGNVLGSMVLDHGYKHHGATRGFPSTSAWIVGWALMTQCPPGWTGVLPGVIHSHLLLPRRERHVGQFSSGAFSLSVPTSSSLALSRLPITFFSLWYNAETISLDYEIVNRSANRNKRLFVVHRTRNHADHTGIIPFGQRERKSTKQIKESAICFLIFLSNVKIIIKLIYVYEKLSRR